MTVEGDAASCSCSIFLSWVVVQGGVHFIIFQAEIYMYVNQNIIYE